MKRLLARVKRWPPAAIALRAQGRMKDDNVSLLSAAVAFWGMLALVPGLVALVSLYGLVADPQEVERQVRQTTEALPEEARRLIVTQLQAIVTSSSAGLGIGLLLGLATALLAASAGVRTLMNAIGVIYGDHPGDRGLVAERGLSLLLTLGAVAFIGVGVLLIAVAPAWLADAGLGGAGRGIVWLLKWPALGFGLVVGIGGLYRVGPANQPDSRLLSAGAITAGVLWVGVSLIFSVYTSKLGSYNETYGSLNAVVVLLLWLQLTALTVLLGAEVNMVLREKR